MEARVRMMSWSNQSGNIAGDGETWTLFQMEDFESPASPREKDEKEFVSLEMGTGEDPGFIPFGEDANPERMRKEAREKATLLEREGYEKGFAQGEKDGLELGEKRALKEAENIENLFSELVRLKKDVMKQYEEEILGLIFAIAKKIIHREIRSDEGVVRDAVINALTLAAERSKVIFRVSPEDYEYVERFRPELFSAFKEMKSIVVTSDPDLTRGGCYLETTRGDLDAGVETRLEKIHQSLDRAFAENRND